MNIKEHIEAGHYPTDDKGRALVPMADGASTFVCCATDRPGGNCLFGWLLVTGAYFSTSWDSRDLLPPSPRKVKVDVLAIVIAGTSTVINVRDADDPPAGLSSADRLVRLTGEYEEPWS